MRRGRFQSTHPLRDATEKEITVKAENGFQSTHPLRDATMPQLADATSLLIFQSTHPLRDATTHINNKRVKLIRFQSTHPLRDATCMLYLISMFQNDFNPRTPYGMRPVQKAQRKNLSLNFNPRTPYGMRLLSDKAIDKMYKISIHAPLTGCDNPI